MQIAGKRTDAFGRSGLDSGRDLVDKVGTDLILLTIDRRRLNRRMTGGCELGVLVFDIAHLTISGWLRPSTLSGRGIALEMA